MLSFHFRFLYFALSYQIIIGIVYFQAVLGSYGKCRRTLMVFIGCVQNGAIGHEYQLLDPCRYCRSEKATQRLPRGPAPKYMVYRLFKNVS